MQNVHDPPVLNPPGADSFAIEKTEIDSEEEHVLGVTGRPAVRIAHLQTRTSLGPCLLDNEAMVDIEIAELRSSMKIPIVGLDVMFRNDLNSNFDSGCVVLCVDNCCLIILAHQISSFPSSLRDFLADETISFVCKESTEPKLC